MQWHQLYDMQTIRTLLQTDNHTNTSSLSAFSALTLLAGHQEEHPACKIA